MQTTPFITQQSHSGKCRRNWKVQCNFPFSSASNAYGLSNTHKPTRQYSEWIELTKCGLWGARYISKCIPGTLCIECKLDGMLTARLFRCISGPGAAPPVGSLERRNCARRFSTISCLLQPRLKRRSRRPLRPAPTPAAPVQRRFTSVHTTTPILHERITQYQAKAAGYGQRKKTPLQLCVHVGQAIKYIEIQNRILHRHMDVEECQWGDNGKASELISFYTQWTNQQDANTRAGIPLIYLNADLTICQLIK